MESDVQMTEYRDIQGCANYRVGSDGSVWCRRGIGFGQSKVIDEWRAVRGQIGRDGYRTVALPIPFRPGKYDKRRVHALVLTSFVGPRPLGMQACHINGDALDNRLANLRWGTPLDNSKDKRRHGTQVKGNTHPMAKLKECEVREICALLDGFSNAAIGTLFGVGRSAIQNIRVGKTWSHITKRRNSGLSRTVEVARTATTVMARRYPKKLRAVLDVMLAASDGKCPSCGHFASRRMRIESDRAMELDHKDPSGGDWIENFQAICRKCNRLKRDYVSPDIVISEWIQASPSVLLEKAERCDAMARNPGWSL